MEDVGIFYDIWSIFMAIMYIVWPFGKKYFVLILYIYFPFWYVAPRKIWQPCVDSCREKSEKGPQTVPLSAEVKWIMFRSAVSIRQKKCINQLDFFGPQKSYSSGRHTFVLRACVHEKLMFLSHNNILVVRPKLEAFMGTGCAKITLKSAPFFNAQFLLSR
jgi:hypothetical protein